MTETNPLADSSHPQILSYTFLSALTQVVEVLCLVAAGLAASRGSGELTVTQSLMLPVLAILPYRQVGWLRREIYWSAYDRLWREVVDVVGGVVSGALVIDLYAWVFRSESRMGDWLWDWTVAAICSVLALRLAMRVFVRQLYRRNKLVHRVAIIGAGPECDEVVDKLTGEAHHRRNYQVVGIFDERSADRRPEMIRGIPVGHGLGGLLELAQTMPIDTIIVSWPLSAARRIAETMEKVRAIPSDFLLLTDFEWLVSKHLRVREFEGGFYLQVARRPLIGTRALFKLIEDYVVASIGILLTAPIMLAAAIAIKREGGGPILFRQKRVGFNHKEFEMLKFRSMVFDPMEMGRDGTKRDDPRVTKVGAFLRRTSIDELPQLFNVLRGEMSVVGPRAHVPGMRVGDQTYLETVAKYAARHRVKPGITGWGQINGMRGGINSEEKAQKGVDLDLDYIDNWSLWLDIVIMFRTVFGGLSGRDVF